MKSVYLGIDTSCYTTSVAAVDESGQLLADVRQLLKVEPGERGLQQSAALFQHVQNLPTLISSLAEKVDMSRVRGIAASTRPRPVKGSYMPVFNASAGQGEIISKLLGIPLIPTSHQEGHLVAGLWSAGGPGKSEFLAVHLSGGTSEILKVKRKKKDGDPAEGLFDIQLLGGSTDLHAGQFVDRVGVRLGLQFPAGPKLELLARRGESGKGLIPSSVQGYDISFSGPESQAQRLIDKGVPPEQVARAVEACIAKTLTKLISRAILEHGLTEVLLVGGVAANQFIRSELQAQLAHARAKLYVAEPRFSSDNAVGVAVIARQATQV